MHKENKNNISYSIHILQQVFYSVFSLVMRPAHSSNLQPVTLSWVMVTSPYECKILNWDEKPQTSKHTLKQYNMSFQKLLFCVLCRRTKLNIHMTGVMRNGPLSFHVTILRKQHQSLWIWNVKIAARKLGSRFVGCIWSKFLYTYIV